MRNPLNLLATLILVLVCTETPGSQCSMPHLTLGGFHNLEAGMPWFLHDDFFSDPKSIPKEWIAIDRNGPDFKVHAAHYGGDDGYWIFDTSRLKAGHEYDLRAGSRSICEFSDCDEYPFRLNVLSRRDRHGEKILVSIANISGGLTDPHKPYPSSISGGGLDSSNTLTVKLAGAVASPQEWMARLDVLGPDASIELSTVGAVQPSHPYGDEGWEFTLWSPHICSRAATGFKLVRGKHHRLYLYDGRRPDLSAFAGIEFIWPEPEPLRKDVAYKMDELRSLHEVNLSHPTPQTLKVIQDWVNANRASLDEHTRWNNGWSLMYADRIPASALKIDSIPPLQPSR